MRLPLVCRCAPEGIKRALEPRGRYLHRDEDSPLPGSRDPGRRWDRGASVRRYPPVLPPPSKPAASAPRPHPCRQARRSPPTRTPGTTSSTWAPALAGRRGTAAHRAFGGGWRRTRRPRRPSPPDACHGAAAGTTVAVSTADGRRRRRRPLSSSYPTVPSYGRETEEEWRRPEKESNRVGFYSSIGVNAWWQ